MSVSIITPYFQTGELFNAAIDSVREQTHLDYEWLIIDDGSKLETADEVLNRFFERKGEATFLKKIRVITLGSNKGPLNARIVGIKHADRRYITFLDSDDRFSSEKLSVQHKFMLSSGCKISHSMTRKFNDTGMLGATFEGEKIVDWRAYLFKRGFPVNTVMVSTEHALNSIKNISFIPPQQWRSLPGEDIVLFESFFWGNCEQSLRIDKVLSWYHVGNSRSSKPIKTIFGLIIYLSRLLCARGKWHLLLAVPFAIFATGISRFMHKI
ncbi:MAG: hypothetical protein CML33_02860 [Rhodobacteraceae bacterium]|nr:hypothetical protein [Paracoccaceae bacterium]